MRPLVRHALFTLVKKLDPLRRAALVPRATGAIDLRPHQLLSVIRRRESRARFFPSTLFADPAWDLLLDLGLARLSGQAPRFRVAAQLSPGALDRWLDLLVEEGLATRRDTQVLLSDDGLEAIDAWLTTGGC